MKNNAQGIFLALLGVISGGLLLPQICHADMVVGFLINYPPLFLALSFVAIVVIEAAELKKRLALSPKKSIIVSLVANTITSLLGIILGYWFRVDIFKNLTYISGWLVALFLGSFILEALVMMLFSIPQSKAKIWQTSLKMNLLSYLSLVFFVILDIVLLSGVIIFAFIIERLFVIFGWARNWSKVKIWMLQFLVFILLFAATFLFVLLIPQN